MRNFTFEKNILKIKEVEILFKHDIDAVEHVDGKYLVLLRVPKGTQEVDNLYAVDSKGKIIWEVQSAEEVFDISKNTPYVAMKVVNSKIVKVTSFFGLRFSVSIVDGKLLEKESIGW